MIVTRQLEVGEYECPLCNTAVKAIAVDSQFHNSDSHNEQMIVKTTYQCLGCREYFYSIEGALKAQSPPPLTCSYCQQPAIYFYLNDDRTDYWKCLPCKTTFMQWRSHSNGNEYFITNMYTVINGHLYVLRQSLPDNRSIIVMLPEDLEDTIVLAQEFSSLLPTVTPTNIAEKIKTYLLFS